MSMKLLIANLVLWGSIAAYALPPAVDKELNNTQASNINHKFDNIDNQADLDDEIVYQASDKAKEIKRANASLKRIRGEI